MIAITTFERIKACLPEANARSVLHHAVADLAPLPVTDDPNSTPVTLVQLARKYGLEIATWCVRSVPDPTRSARLFACDLADAFASIHRNSVVQGAVDYARSQISDIHDLHRLQVQSAAIRTQRNRVVPRSPVFFAMTVAISCCDQFAADAATYTLADALKLAKMLTREGACSQAQALFQRRFGQDDTEERIALGFTF